MKELEELNEQLDEINHGLAKLYIMSRYNAKDILRLRNVCEEIIRDYGRSGLP